VLKKRNAANDGWDTLGKIRTDAEFITDVNAVVVRTVNAQTGTTYNYLTSDFRKLVSHTNGSAIAGTLPQAGASFPAGWYVLVQNRGTGVLTITPTTSTIDGGTTLVLNQNEGAIIVSDGTNYFTLRGKATGAAGVGDVVGPSSSIDSEIALFDSTTGKLLKRASVTGLLKAASGVLSAAVAGTDYSVPTASVNAQTGTTYTLLASDNGKIVTCSNASPITVTVPSGLGAGFNCLVIQKGAGQITFSPSSTTINNRQTHTKSAGQHALCTLAADVADNFYLGGDTSA
jgi:hypothetical protein